MKEFKFTNNAKESFNLFKNEEEETCLNFSQNNELIACFILSEEETEELRLSLGDPKANKELISALDKADLDLELLGIKQSAPMRKNITDLLKKFS